MYNGRKVKELLAINGRQCQELLEYLGSTSRTTIAQLVNGNPTVKRLEQVADFFGVSMDVFFNRTFQGEDRNIDKLATSERQALMDLLSAKDQLIADKERTIRLLEEYVEALKKAEKIDEK